MPVKIYEATTAYTNTLIRNVKQILRTPVTDLEQMWLCIKSVLWSEKNRSFSIPVSDYSFCWLFNDAANSYTI
jgi:hypothetical protein